MNKTDSSRRLGSGEAFYWMADRVCTMNFTVVARLSGTTDEDSLRSALLGMPERHPLLGVRISDERNGPVFRTDGVGEMPILVMDAAPDEWMERAEEQVNKVFDWRRGPLARVVWLRHRGDESTLLVTFHHAVGDGISAGFLIRDILAALKDSTRPPADDATTSLPLSLTEYFPEYARGVKSAIRYVREMTRAALVMVRTGRLRAVRPDQKKSLRSLRVRVIPRFLDADMTGCLRDRARGRGPRCTAPWPRRCCWLGPRMRRSKAIRLWPWDLRWT